MAHRQRPESREHYPKNQSQMPRENPGTSKQQPFKGQMEHIKQKYKEQPMDVDHPSNYSHQMEEQHYRQDFHRARHHRQAQTQEQMQRSLQASKQMLYGVFENVISQLEEFESRELGQGSQMQKSAIYVPDQSWKTDDDIRGLAEAQLLMFEKQMKFCPKSVREEARMQLIDETLKWLSSRTDHKCPIGAVDHFAAQLMEILIRGKTKHPEDLFETPKMTGEELKDAAQTLMHGNSMKDDLDRRFKETPDRKASLSKIRSGQRVTDGAERINVVRPDLVGEIPIHTMDLC